MKIKLLSDLHLEFAPFEISYSGEDILILAGDISPSIKEVKKLITTYLNKSPDTQVIFIMGNHDYYDETIENKIHMFRNLNIDRFHLLQDDSITINDVCFYGSTMWTDMNCETPEICEQGIADFHQIKEFSIDKFRNTHSCSRNSLSEFLNKSDNPVIVITHHLPTYKSIDNRWIDSPYNPSFASTDLQCLVNNYKVLFWCHGHTHSNLDYFDEETRILCNPRGIVKMWKDKVKKCENPNFDKDYIFEIL